MIIITYCVSCSAPKHLPPSTIRHDTSSSRTNASTQWGSINTSTPRRFLDSSFSPFGISIKQDNTYEYLSKSTLGVFFSEYVQWNIVVITSWFLHQAYQKISTKLQNVLETPLNATKGSEKRSYIEPLTQLVPILRPSDDFDDFQYVWSSWGDELPHGFEDQHGMLPLRSLAKTQKPSCHKL